MSEMNWKGDSIRRFNGAFLISIEKKGGEQDDYIFSNYVINYSWNGLQKFVELRSQYILEYRDSRNMNFIHTSKDKSDEEANAILERFMKSLLELLEGYIFEGKPVNLIIEAVHKGGIVHFLKKIEFN